MDRHFLRRSAAWSLAALILGMCGCSIFPEAMQPQNLQKLNRGPAPSRDPFFSIPDRIPVDAPATDPFNDHVDAALNPERI